MSIGLILAGLALFLFGLSLIAGKAKKRRGAVNQGSNRGSLAGCLIIAGIALAVVGVIVPRH